MFSREDYYTTVGQSAWRCIAASMLVAGVEEPRRILDLPCGHGRVLRVLRQAFPDAELTACDIDRDGVDFCAAEFGATPVYSEVDLERLRFAQPFDLIWCGSLVTHLDVRGWLATFQTFVRALRPGGLAMITFHGRWVAYLIEQGHHYGLPRASIEAMLTSYAANGFGYADYEATPGYGISISSPAWVLRELDKWQHLRIVGLTERWWDDHQDVLVVQKMP
jgi:SAM-dependent methyltransferase